MRQYARRYLTPWVISFAVAFLLQAIVKRKFVTTIDIWFILLWFICYIILTLKTDYYK